MFPRKIFLFFILFVQYCVAQAQYTYIEGGIGYGVVAFHSSGYSGGNTNNNCMNVRLSIINRFIRNLGIGIQASVPVVQGGTFGFRNPENGNIFMKFNSYRPRYHVTKFGYSFHESPRATLFLRGFFDTRINSYIDARISVLRMTESFTLHRPYHPGVYNSYFSSDNYNALPELKINYIRKHLLFIPGLVLGMQPHLGKHLFLNANIGIDFFVFGKSGGFKYKVPYDWDTSYKDDKYMELGSQARGTKVSFTTNIGFGYYF